jgi:hypothetical protein
VSATGLETEVVTEGDVRVERLRSLDAAIETLRRTGADMQSKYKETALGGLAITVATPASIAQAEC